MVSATAYCLLSSDSLLSIHLETALQDVAKLLLGQTEDRKLVGHI